MEKYKVQRVFLLHSCDGTTVDKYFRGAREPPGELGRTAVTFAALEFFPARLPVLETRDTFI